MVGRWKSGKQVNPGHPHLRIDIRLVRAGTPIDIKPTQDDSSIAGDPMKNNDFDFSSDMSQDRCPFAAHIRKTSPRSDLKLLGGTIHRRIWRQGIPYGPEVTPEERQQKKTIHNRGLLFACYQSSIENGFSFMQQGQSHLNFM
jgi:deferrochelatase/peroxidase EfeB